ncbi:MarR family winged helix-turn-helix transcriptional regulator [Nocardioides bruguierae]|uniref:MarR family winged helix-turn-helix transcriptional regulator n=1 Tax=Nocardioides bruguierae TaxID=2945102 RepID=A0A9X2D6N1_9ACTN|nr:MarR family winged helix-turn-helix transcriptional regulator [Nocardioides bruguierae]MCL8027194.1 MarR family winged helix-turn-helix transcriptional regulator [Nocardioides bruguierae]MCM0620014.1 MarR family winged helix-turn-helix transcriptional regulator [Nocardioides bruguierae]
MTDAANPAEPTDPTDLGTAADETEIDALVGRLLTASRALVGVSARSLADVEDTVTLSQFRTLVVLDSHGATRLAQLAERLGVGPSTALRAVDRLIAQGHAERRGSEVDRREVVIEASTQGRDLVAEVTRRRRAAIEKVVLGMPPEHREALVEALAAFADAADEPPVDSATLLGW